VIVGDFAALFLIDPQDFVFARFQRRGRTDADTDIESTFA